MTDLVKNPEDMFFHDATHFVPLLINDNAVLEYRIVHKLSHEKS